MILAEWINGDVLGLGIFAVALWCMVHGIRWVLGAEPQHLREEREP